MEELSTYQHRRYNPLSGEWLLVSPHRTERPWLGRQETPSATTAPEYDKNCYLCPGNRRANGERNPHYRAPYIFENDYAALRSTTPTFNYEQGELLRAESEHGICKVLCYAPQHNLHLIDMEHTQIKAVVKLWQEEAVTIGGDPHIQHVQIFENRGEAMGSSNPHPHGQLWANQSIPHIAQRKAIQQQRYFESHNSPLLSDYLKKEEQVAERIIFMSRAFCWLVPFWAVWPYETMIIIRRSCMSIEELKEEEFADLAHILQLVVATYDRIFECPFPYSMGVHLPPTTTQKPKGWQLHIGFYPPLLRSASVRKFMVGYELCAMPQRDITPEYAAQQLRILCQGVQQ